MSHTNTSSSINDSDTSIGLRMLDEIDEGDDNVTTVTSREDVPLATTGSNSATEDVTPKSVTNDSLSPPLPLLTEETEEEDSKLRAMEEWLRQQEEEEEEGKDGCVAVFGEEEEEEEGEEARVQVEEEEEVHHDNDIEQVDIDMGGVIPNVVLDPTIHENDHTVDDPIQPPPPVEVEEELPVPPREDQLIFDHLPPDLIDDILQQQQQQQRMNHHSNKRRPYLLTYRPLSFISFVLLMWYALRTRKQYYFTVVYLCHSKYAYVIFGNTIIATAIVLFDVAIYLFFRTTTTTNTNTNRPNENQNQDAPTTTTTTTTTTTGLRIQEAEGLQDFFRWNVTETCLALTMFRYELTIVTAIQFVFLILLKCLHYVAAQREQHLRMTEDAIMNSMTTNMNPIDGDDHVDTHPTAATTTSTSSKHSITSYMKSIMLFLRSNHTSIIVFFILLQGIDMYIIQHCILQILNAGQPSVKILFAFEAAILLVSTYCHVILYILHVMDCAIQYGNDILEHRIAKQLLHPWKEYKATFIFAIELQAQAINFLFYCTFFCIVLTFYGLPINLFREVYMSFIKLKERLTSFFHYRQLMASMNRFRTATDEELNQSGRTCIICRDEMTSGHDCKRLPVCTHTFHKSCLREWLVQQQSCPTCRADIAAMEALEATRTAAANAATQRNTTTNESTGATDVTTTETTTTAETTVAVVTQQMTEQNTDTNAVQNDQDNNLLPSIRGMEKTSTDVPTSSSSASFSNAAPVVHATNRITGSRTHIRGTEYALGVIQPIPPTLYEVIGVPQNQDITGNDVVPVYSHDHIVSAATTLDSSNAVMVPIRSIGKNAIVLGMAKYQKAPSDSRGTATPKVITYIQLPDQTWIQDDYLQSICILPQK